MDAKSAKAEFWRGGGGLLLFGAVLVAVGLLLFSEAREAESDHIRARADAYRTAQITAGGSPTTPIQDEVTAGGRETGKQAPSESLGPPQIEAVAWVAEARSAVAGYRTGAYACVLAGGLFLLAGVIRWAMQPYDAAIIGADGIRARLADHSALLDSINERMLISDAAKRVVFRAKDRQALRQAIREDIDRDDFDAALVLVDEMGGRYGYREEAEVFREEILATRQASMDERLSNAIHALDGYLDRGDWQRATQESAKIRRLFPDHPRAVGIERRVRDARDLHKHDLERQFLDAAQRDDVDRAWELMKELDEHLTEADAEPFREIARGVIGKKRENLGVQFKLAVHDRDWVAAVDVGEQIIRDFPNTKMASEVRTMLDLLRERAAGQRAARA